MDWLRRHRKDNNLTNQNIKFQFSNEILASLSDVMPVGATVNEVSNLSDNWSFWSEGIISVGKIGDTSSSSSKDDDEEEKEYSGDETESDGEFPGSSDEESVPLSEDSELDEENYDYDNF